VAGTGGSLNIDFLDSWHSDRSLGSGSTVAIAGLAEGLRTLGHRVRVLRPGRALPTLDATRLAFNVGLRQRLATTRADLVVGFDFDGCFLRSDLTSPYVVSLKGVMADEKRYEAGWDRARFEVMSRLERRNARRADRVIVTSDHSRNVAVSAYDLDPARVRVVPEGIDVDAWSAIGGGDRPSGAPPVIVSIARQYRRKNTAGLLRAMPGVLDRIPGVRLRIVGDGPELPRLESLASALGLDDGSVVFTGSLGGREAVQRELAEADVFCLPSRQEGFGIVLLEAMAAGLPIVAADSGATPEVAPHDEVALLVPPDDAVGLEEALVRVLTDRGLWNRLAAAGARRWRRYSWPSVARSFLVAATAA
jgi:glycosyltransferase involved in cell wall biosynthesis